MSMASVVDLACGVPDGPRAPVLLVMLPGAYDTPADFVQHGFVAALRARHVDVDVQLVDAHVSHYMQQAIVERLRQMVIQPALQAGYREIWLAGISIGGLGSLLYSATHPSDISGVVALAPYLGSRHISVQAERAGGLRHWPREGFPPPEDESDQRLWLWLKARAEQGDAGQPLYWGYGEHDRFAHGHKLVAQALQADRVAVVDGAHDWPTWAALWQLMLERLPWPSRPDAAKRSLPRPGPMQPLRVRAYTATCAAGEGVAALVRALHRPVSALQPHDTSGGGAWSGHVGPVAALAGVCLPPALQAWDCRNNRLAWLALNQDGFLQAAQAAVARHGATRVAVLMGTSTSSIGASEEAYTRLTPQGQFPPDLARPEVHMLHSLGAFVAQALGAQGPCMTVATACSSSAKVFAQAERLIRCGMVDAAVVGGVDSLCHSVLYGFQALGLVSARLCRPFDVARDGINLAEAGGFALLERADARSEASPAEVYLIGHGESSDAHHMSAPHPQGLGAMRAMQEALARAGIKPGDVGYINLHGTGTPKNDAAEAAVVSALFPPGTRVGSTKGWTGHTLGAAGILEAVICMLALQQGWMPGSLHTEHPDPALGEAFASMLQLDTAAADTEVAMSNSFGFGGNNCALLFARTARGRA